MDGLTEPIAGGTASLRSDLGGPNSTFGGSYNYLNDTPTYLCSTEYEASHDAGSVLFFLAGILGGDDAPISEEPPGEEGLGFPPNKAQYGHIMANRDGHLPDTPENRELLKEAGSNPENYVRNQNGKELYAQQQPDGTEIWVEVSNGVIQNGGVNKTPRYNTE